MKTIKQIRESFWQSHPEFKTDYRKSYRQNQYNADIRSAFVNYVDILRRDNVITEDLAYRATL